MPWACTSNLIHVMQRPNLFCYRTTYPKMFITIKLYQHISCNKNTVVANNFLADIRNVHAFSCLTFYVILCETRNCEHGYRIGYSSEEQKLMRKEFWLGKDTSRTSRQAPIYLQSHAMHIGGLTGPH